MDLVDKEDPKRKRYNERKEELMRVNEKVEKEVGEQGREITCFPTSIWDESLYKVRLHLIFHFKEAVLTDIHLFRLGHQSSTHSSQTYPS